MIARTLADKIKQAARQFPIVTVTGPRQSDKTTLVQAVFESFVVSEMYKNFIHRGEQASLYFWRDSTGRKVDIIIDLGKELIPLETKSAQTVASDFFDNLVYWWRASEDDTVPAALIYATIDHIDGQGWLCIRGLCFDHLRFP